MATRTPIAQIRREIARADGARSMLTGSGRDADFIRQPVADTLLPRIAALRALDIAPRFADDIAWRDRELARCEETVARWTALQAPTAPQAWATRQYDRAAIASRRSYTCGCDYRGPYTVLYPVAGVVDRKTCPTHGTPVAE